MVHPRKILVRAEVKKYYKSASGQNAAEVVLELTQVGKKGHRTAEVIPGSRLIRTFETEWNDAKETIMRGAFQFLATLQILGILGLLSHLEFGGEKIPKMGIYFGKQYGPKPSFMVCAEYGFEILSGPLVLVPVVKQSVGTRTVLALKFWEAINACYILTTFLIWPAIRFLYFRDTKLAEKFYDDPFLMSIFPGVLHLLQFRLLSYFFRRY